MVSQAVWRKDKQVQRWRIGVLFDVLALVKEEDGKVTNEIGYETAGSYFIALSFTYVWNC